MKQSIQFYNLSKMKRVLIIGNAGSGKTTLAKKLSLQLKIPLVSLDSLFWKPGWVELSRAEFDQLLQIEL
ncbi:MAG: AAA family ATPase, partial [Bdellovibrionales bacterium]|nr:AAA family ATPase [Bdellovibrionales bacterium]